MAVLSGVVLLSGGSIYSLISEKYGETLAPTAIGFAQLGGIAVNFAAPALMGAIIGVSHSFSAAFGLFAAIEVTIFAALILAAR